MYKTETPVRYSRGDLTEKCPTVQACKHDEQDEQDEQDERGEDEHREPS